jgi:protein with PEP-CTERM/exosortase system signal
MKNITKWLLASAACGLLSLASAQAVTVGPLQMSYTNDSQYLVGTVIPGSLSPPGQLARDIAMTNTLEGMALQTQMGSGTAADPLYSRTTWPQGPLATTGSTFSQSLGQIQFDSNGNVSITLTGTFQYLVAAYDGQNSGVAVFDISSFHAGDTILLYSYAKPEVVNGHLTGNLLGTSTQTQGYYFITSFSLLNPLGVPDGGATVMLLGAALGALGMVRRYLIS